MRYIHFSYVLTYLLKLPPRMSLTKWSRECTRSPHPSYTQLHGSSALPVREYESTAHLVAEMM